VFLVIKTNTTIVIRQFVKRHKNETKEPPCCSVVVVAGILRLTR